MSKFPALVWPGWYWSGLVVIGLAWLVLVWPGWYWSGLVVIGLAWLVLLWPGWYWSGLVGIGLAWLVLVWPGWYWSGLVGIGLAWLGFVRRNCIGHNTCAPAADQPVGISDLSPLSFQFDSPSPFVPLSLHVWDKVVRSAGKLVALSYFTILPP